MKNEMKNDEIRLEKIPDFGYPVEKSSVPGFVKHVRCEGARFHVISYEGRRSGAVAVCSEPKCIINHIDKT